jgi:hypothetical protein
MNNEEEKYIPAQASYENLALTIKTPGKNKGVLFATLGVIGLIAVIGFKQKGKKS